MQDSIDQGGEIFDNYHQKLKQLINNLDKGQFNKVLNTIIECKNGKGTVYIIGNGGSASTAEHWVNDLVKISGIKAVSLTNISVITALGNDISYDDIFVEQLKIFLEDKDIVIAITGSGNSPNIVKALRYVKENSDAKMVGILGFDGGECLKILEDDPYILIKSNDYGLVESLHLCLIHYFAKSIR